MRILVVAGNVGRSPAGIVTEEIIHGLIAAGQELMIVCTKCHSSFGGHVTVEEYPFSKSLTQMHKVQYIMLNRDPRWKKWIERTAADAAVKARKYNPDFILSISGGQTDRIPALANELSGRIGKPFHLHSVDAVPSPEAWGVNRYLRNAVKKSVKPHFQAAKSISLTNEVMLDYQLKEMGIKKRNNTFVFYNPYKGDYIKGEKSAEEPYALYLGSLSKVRHARKLVEAMQHVANEYPDFRLNFVGTDQGLVESYVENGVLPDNISVYEWTDDPESFIKKASILIDIDIDTDGDVFLSSKLVRYLHTDIPILSITCQSSPAEQLLEKAGEGTRVVRHDSSQIKNELLLLMKEGSISVESNKRKSLQKHFSLGKNITKLLNVYR